MYDMSLPIVFCLFLFTSGLVCEPAPEEKPSRNYEPLPECTEVMRQPETATRLAACPVLNQTRNLANTGDCCQYWRQFACEKDILFALPACQTSRFYIEMQVNLYKPEHTCVNPPASCVNVTNNRAITTVTETLFRPITPFQEADNFKSCLADIKEGLAKCMLTFDDLLEPARAANAAICHDELAFKDCAKKLADGEASCQQIKKDLDRLYTTMAKNVAKKCSTNGAATGVSLTLPFFIFSLIVAFFARNV